MNLQEVNAAEQDLMRFAAAFRSANDLASAIKAAKGVIVGIHEHERKLAAVSAEVEAARAQLADVKRELATAQTDAARAKAELSNAKEALSSLASKLFGSK